MQFIHVSENKNCLCFLIRSRFDIFVELEQIPITVYKYATLKKILLGSRKKFREESSETSFFLAQEEMFLGTVFLAQEKYFLRSRK